MSELGAPTPPDPFAPSATGFLPPVRTEHDGLPTHSFTATRGSSAEDEKFGAHDEHAGHHPPSTNISGASSVSGATHLPQPTFAPLGLSVKKGPQSFFSGSKIKHLKKADGIPLWRVDIQYEFLQAVFKDPDPVFTNVYTGQKGFTFADIYVDAMARSSKTSKILRDKLMTERENAINMAMVCLLVNVGRMNTTLNFFPEMKAQLRTYHAIPSLQAHTDSNAYKQLQDAPRLKSILKGACEDQAEPQTLDQVMTLKRPRTNPINLVFILSTYAPKVSECHFPENMDFYDLVMRTTLSSKSRARAFLWLMWLYLESDFSEHECLENPFGKGKYGRDKSKPMCVPDFEYLNEEQALKENVDTKEEIEYGNAKQEERKRLLDDIHNAPVSQGRGRGRKSLATAASPDVMSPTASPPPGSARRGARPRYPQPYDDESDSHTRSVSPEPHFQTPLNGSKNRRVSNFGKIPSALNTGDSGLIYSEIPRNKGGRPKKRMADGEIKVQQRIILTKAGRPLVSHEGAYATPSGKSLAVDRSSPMLERTHPRQRMTSHQLAVQQNRIDRVNHVINKKLQRLDHRKKKQRFKQGAMARAWNRIRELDEPLNMSDDDSPLCGQSDFFDDGGSIGEIEHPVKRQKLDKSARSYGVSHKRGPAGLVPRKGEETGDPDEDDFGEECMSLAAAIRRTQRRMKRWEEMDKGRMSQGLALVNGFPTAEEDEMEVEHGDAEADGEAEGESDEDEDADLE